MNVKLILLELIGLLKSQTNASNDANSKKKNYKCIER